VSLPLSPEMVEAAYDYLRITPPFRRWKLPAGEEVVFHITGVRSHMASYWYEDKRHNITVSAKMVGHTETLFRAVAHEMAHMRQHVMGDKSLAHNANFFRLTARIAKYHGFDPKEL